MTATIHKLCAILPDMGEDDFDTLVESVNTLGQQEAIVMLGAEILDGRHRWKACEKLGIPPTTRQFDPARDGPSPAAYVLWRNLGRRNMTLDQKALAGAVLADELTAERKRQGIRGRGRVRDEAAALVGVSGRLVGTAKMLADADPVAFAAVKAGKITLADAVRALPPRAEPVPDDKRNLAIDQLAVLHGDAMAAAVRAGKLLPGKWLREFSELAPDMQRAILPLVKAGWAPVPASRFHSGIVDGTDTVADLVRIAEWHAGEAKLIYKGWKITVEEN